MTDSPLPEHVRPVGVTDATVEALGKLSEALEAAEVCRGHLYAFHRRSGTADLTLGEAVDLLRKAGHEELADQVDSELVGHNVIQGRWTFQLVEEYDDTYWTPFRELEREAREQLVDGRRHLYEAEMKERERTAGDAHHTAVPDDSGPQGGGG
jgi:nucleotide-binding universal stress UspA family protein